MHPTKQSLDAGYVRVDRIANQLKEAFKFIAHDCLAEIHPQSQSFAYVFVHGCHKNCIAAEVALFRFIHRNVCVAQKFIWFAITIARLRNTDAA